MYTSTNHPFPQKKLKILASKQSAHTVTIYLPMNKKGKEQNEHLAQAHLKKCVKEIHQTLTNYQLNKVEINNYLKPIEDLIANVDLWRNPSDGLAVFLDQNGISYYTLPIAFEVKTYVSNHFYLKPLLPLYYEDGVYFLLELSADYVKLYKCSKFSYKDLNIENFAPNQLKKAIGTDYKDKMLQFRTGHSAHTRGSFHGYGEGKDDYKKELITFFRAIDLGVKKLIDNRKAPLLLACTDQLYPLYKEASLYPNLYKNHLNGDPEFKNKTLMHQESWSLMQDYFNATKKDKIDLFTELYNTQKVSYSPSEIISAAIHGKIDTLFVKKGTDLFGIYYNINNSVRLDESKEITNTSLLNLACMQTFLQGGNVFELDPEHMPIKEQPINAIFRY
ncbi:hypothetical protein [Olleya sp. HaHaR_3_96]|uniref:baeRF7 domain-containing protein n=1 Tax=Olleya sp. HaHaR_3_96 TaxID=2745560 RepID=UPI001C4F210F|nr:hypothetical protein [Olleya sp. HaHaR_3_96]QXP58313.1 hypothetical protein H0I26_10305 [Olleya sp. HaHaR_3_96]